jgi:hypothetical protein
MAQGAHSKIPGIEPILLKRGENLHANRYPAGIHSRYLGKAFPKDIIEFEIREFFNLSATYHRAIRVDSNKRSRLALASRRSAMWNR